MTARLGTLLNGRPGGEKDDELREMCFRWPGASLMRDAPRSSSTAPAAPAEASPESSAPAPDGPSALRFVHVTKRFPGVTALSDVNLEVRPGEVHGLVGENGAGKSTLMAIGAGSLAADEGEVYIGERLLERAHPEVARESGLAIVYQEPALMPDLTVAENLALGVSRGHRPGWMKARDWAKSALTTWARNRKINPTLPVRDLGPDIRFMVEISKALAQAPKVLLLDEPTEHLAADDVEILFTQVRELAAAGTAVVYISHRIPEVRLICDRISVLRDGELQGTFNAPEISQEEIVNRIVGRPLETAFPPKRSPEAPDDLVLSVKDLRANRFADLNLEIRAGEIVGLAGVEGNGQREVIRALAGLLPARGEVRVGDQGVRLGSNTAAAAAGIAHIPGDRHREGIFSILGVRENVAIGNIAKYAQSLVVRPDRERAGVAARVRALDVKTPSLETPVASLSGGNQQKTVLGRALEREPRLILADEPTQGVDVGARLEIYRFLREAVTQGAGVLVVASDAAELEGLCDRVLVMSRGHVVRELTGDEVTEQNMTQAALTATTSRSGDVAIKKETRPLRFLRGDYAPSAIVMAVVILLGAYTTTQNSFYLTGRDFTGVLALFAALALVTLAQQVVMMAGGIDLSVGPLMGLLVVIGSFVIIPGRSGGGLILGWLLLIAVALVVGVINWLPTLIGVPPFLATLVTYTGIQGVSLLLRPTPAGAINAGVTKTVTSTIGWVPWAAIVAVALGIALEIILRRTTWGVQLRAVGSSAGHARAVGVPVRRVQLSSYLAAGLLVFLASILLMAQVGAGDPTSGTSYTLVSITAVVLGGASIFGGRGAFIGALVGAALIQQIDTTTTFLNVNLAWQTYLLGILLLIAAGIYSKARDIRVG